MTEEIDDPLPLLNTVKHYVEDEKPFINVLKIRKRKLVEPPTKIFEEIIKVIESNNSKWACDFFLADEYNGLTILSDYLQLRLTMLRIQQMSTGKVKEETTNVEVPKAKRIYKEPKIPCRLIRRANDDDIYFCMMCFRSVVAIEKLVNSFAKHRRLVDALPLGLFHPDVRVKTNSLELLAFVCCARGGHRSVMSAFEYFKEITGEPRRFKTLVETLANNVLDPDFVEVFIHLIHAIVYKASTYNYRVYLQHEFLLLGVDDFFDSMQRMDSDCVQAQLQSYVRNMVDVDQLMEDSNAKKGLTEKVEELEIELLEAKTKIKHLEQQVERSRLMNVLITRVPQVETSRLLSVPSTSVLQVETSRLLSAPSTSVPQVETSRLLSVPSTSVPQVETSHLQSVPSTSVPQVETPRLLSVPSTSVQVETSRLLSVPSTSFQVETSCLLSVPSTSVSSTSVPSSSRPSTSVPSSSVPSTSVKIKIEPL